MPGQNAPEDPQYHAAWAEQQRRMQLEMMDAAYMRCRQQMEFGCPAMMPLNVPMQQFSG